MACIDNISYGMQIDDFRYFSSYLTFYGASSSGHFSCFFLPCASFIVIKKTVMKIQKGEYTGSTFTYTCMGDGEADSTSLNAALMTVERVGFRALLRLCFKRWQNILMLRVYLCRKTAG